MLGSILGAVAGGLVNKALGGGSQSAQSQKIPGVEFQPFTYKGSTGSVTGTQAEDGYGYDWSADVSPWISQLGELGSGAAQGMFRNYLDVSQVDPFAASQEYYSRGLAQIEPQIAKEREALAGSLFGSGRLGLKIAGEGAGYGTGAGAVNPDIAGFGAGVSKTYSDLYAKSLSESQRIHQNYLNQLSTAADQMFKLGMKPAEIEQNLIKFSADLEKARSNALKQGTQTFSPQETLGSQLGGTLAPIVSKGVSGMFSGGGSSSVPDVTSVYDSNAFAVGGGNPFWS